MNGALECQHGPLTGLLWNADAPGTPVLAAHGITANGASFLSLAERLSAPVFAPDLRGRGKSRALGEPFTLRQHAQDLSDAADSLGWSTVRIVGHSMGAFVSVRLAHARPDLVDSLWLIDGGLPLRPSSGDQTADGEGQSVLGPAIERLSMEFATPKAYRDFWHEHPALGPYWNRWIEAYVDSDLFADDEGVFHPGAVPEAVLVNLHELGGVDGYVEALEGVAGGATLFVSPRGLFDETPGLYDPEWLTAWRTRLPGMHVVAMPETNHYTLLMSESAQVIADVIEGSRQ